MRTEEMRQEFEAAVRKGFASLGKLEPDLRRDSKDDYILPIHAAAWWAWAASRDAYANEVREAIKAAGLKVAP